jgi:hypothetical protein
MEAVGSLPWSLEDEDDFHTKDELDRQTSLIQDVLTRYQRDTYHSDVALHDEQNSKG